MARIERRAEVELDAPTLIEGLPGLGLVGKLATDHLVDQFEMTYYASVHCEGLPGVGVYREGDRIVRPAVRLYADAERDLLALQSDVPVSASAAPDFAECITGWIDAQDALPVYFSGYPGQSEADPRPVFGVATTDDAAERLVDLDVAAPSENGAVGGPTGALLERAAETGVDGIGLIVESDPQFPDPEAAAALIEQGIGPLAGVDADVSELRDRAEEIRAQKEQLARRMQQAATDASPQAQPIRMFQ